MNRQKFPLPFLFLIICSLCIISCNNGGSGNKKIVHDPEKMDEHTNEAIENALALATAGKGKIDDSTHLQFTTLVKDFYSSNNFATVWSHKEKWEPMVDSLLRFIEGSELYGLFPKDYQPSKISALKKELDADSIKRMDAQLWTRADLLLTDAFMHVVQDLKKGRIGKDSTFLKKSGPPLQADFYAKSLHELFQKKQFSAMISSLEPANSGYVELKKALANFLDSMDRNIYTYVPYPYKAGNAKDSLFFIKLLQNRLKESGCMETVSKMADSVELEAGIKKYQKKKGVKSDGKISAPLVRLLNNTDAERHKRIAITLDRYKQLPAEMPEKYIWVNLPSYYMQLYDHDTVVINSKIICGKPETKTPHLYSVISDMVTYPTWTVPNSIIRKQYLPKLKTNPYYLSRIGLRLVDGKGETVDPGSINWSKYTKGIPFKVVQGSGDDNALGVIKFNFNNPYSVYLHDTNQRYLFKNAARALSHGCVRVERWQELAYYIARNDSLNLKEGDSLRYTTDSLATWLANKEKKRVTVKNGIPLFIAYFSCEGKNGKVRFYNDIYGEDKMIREKFFSGK